MNALESLLRPATAVLNRNIQEITQARTLCAELEGTVVAIRVSNTALAAYFEVQHDCVDLTVASDQEPNVVISGSLLALTKMLIDADPSMLRDGSIELTGDAEVAQQFQDLLTLARPDLEEELASIVGDIAAHRVGNMARGIASWGRNARSTMAANVREYLQEESRDAPSRFEAEEFADDVGVLRDDVDRIEARLNRLRKHEPSLKSSLKSNHNE